jgi:hypothetical protein
MTLTANFDHAREKVTARAAGPISLEDVRNHLDVDAKSLTYRELIDARGYVPSFSAADVREIVSTLRELALKTPLGPTPIVVDSEVGYGMVRMVEILIEDVAEVKPFRNLEDAERWLARERR